MMVGLITTSLTITTVKLAFLVLYRRIFPTPAFIQKTLIVGIAYIAWFIVVPLTNLFQYQPFNAAFDPDLLFTDSCIDLQAFYWGVVSPNPGIDIVMLYLPTNEVRKLHLPRKQKSMLSGVFLLCSL